MPCVADEGRVQGGGDWPGRPQGARRPERARGLTFSLLSYPSAAGPEAPVAGGTPLLSTSDLELWALGQFATVAEVRAALDRQPVMLEALALLGGAVSPFHYVVNDASEASLVIEFHKGALSVYDNPVRVMTNGPSFDLRLTSLDNYTFLSNVDRPTSRFGDCQAAHGTAHRRDGMAGYGDLPRDRAIPHLRR